MRIRTYWNETPTLKGEATRVMAYDILKMGLEQFAGTRAKRFREGWTLDRFMTRVREGESQLVILYADETGRFEFIADGF